MINTIEFPKGIKETGANYFNDIIYYGTDKNFIADTFFNGNVEH